jgi:hypothetical protein
MHKSIFITALLLCSFLASAKDLPLNKISNKELTKSTFVASPIDSLNWKLLGMIKFIKKADKEYGEIMYPQVSPLLKQKSSKKIAISGFIIPIDNTTYALSKYVFASCFFCGNAGPETIMGIKFKGDTPKLKTDQYVTLVGNFRINENDVEDWIYHIDNAVIVKGK